MRSKIGLLVFAALLLAVAWAVPAYGAGISVQESVYEVVYYYQNNETALANWEEVVALDKAGADLSAWTLPGWDLDSLDVNSSSATYATTILGMRAAGQDPENADGAGRDLVAELVGRQTGNVAFGTAITDTVWSMIALDEAQADYDEDGAAAYLIGKQLADGGFAYTGSTGDPDITGIVLLALAPHTSSPGVSEAISDAVDCLHDLQLDNGGFAYGVTENTESIASVIRGLVACGEDITADAWKKNGKTMIDALFAFQMEDKSFSHIIGGNHNDMATRQALTAIADMMNAGVTYEIVAGGQSGEDPADAGVRVRVEGASAHLADEVVTVEGTALDALRAVVGEANVELNVFGMISGILGESGQSDVVEGIDTNWMYYVIRAGEIDPAAFDIGANGYSVENGDQVVFYIGACDATYDARTYFPVISTSPASPTAGQSITISISAKKYVYPTGLQDLDAGTADDIGNYTVQVGATEYTSSFGQVTIPDVAQGVLSYTVSNYNDSGYPDVVAYKGRINVGAAIDAQVRVRVEGAVANLEDAEVTVNGTALDALEEAVGEDNVQFNADGMISGISGESGQSNVAEGINTNWMYYVIRNGEIDTAAFSIGADGYNIKNGDQVVFYIGANDSTTWDAKTYFPQISISPAAPTAGNSLVFTITARKNAWGSLQDLSAEEIAAIGNYKVIAGGSEYTSSNGTVTIPNVAAGVLRYTVSNPNAAGYPDVITYSGSITVGNPGGGPEGQNGITVQIAVVGRQGNLLFGPGSVQISKDDEYGLTAMSALDATGLSWAFSDSWDGLVVNIDGEISEGMNGWMFSVNGNNPVDVPMNTSVSAGDRVIFWYSTDPMQEGPSWSDLLSGKTQIEVVALTDLDKAEIQEYLSGYSDKLSELLKSESIKTEVVNMDKKMTPEAAAALKEELEANTVAVSQEVGKTEAVLGDLEVSMLVPENALTATQTLTINEMAKEEEPRQFAVRLATSTYEFGPSGTKFDKPVTISLKIPITEDLNLENLAPAWYDEVSQQWIPIPGVIDLEKGEVLFQIDHFTKFAVISLPSRVKFDDVDENMAWAQEAIEVLAGQGIIKGAGNGFEPQRNVSRAEFVQLLVTALKLDAGEYEDGLFDDVNSSDWFAAAVACAYTNKLVSGYPDKTFRPNNSISRIEAALIFDHLEGSPDDYADTDLDFKDIDEIPVWATNGVKYVYKKGLMNGYEENLFKGGDPLTRAEAAVIVYKYLSSLASL